jgi:hypothetical protein
MYLYERLALCYCHELAYYANRKNYQLFTELEYEVDGYFTEETAERKARRKQHA